MPNTETNKKPPKKEVDIDNGTLSFLMVILVAILIILLVTAAYFVIVKVKSPTFIDGETNKESAKADYPFRQSITLNISHADDDSAKITDTHELNSDFATLVDLTDGKTVASSKSSALIYPASMTKVMTLIVVYENLPNAEALDEVLEIKYPRGEHSGYGFEMGEKLTVKDLIYASILQSDGVACLTLADYIAGGEKQFVKMMNDKVKELGLLEGDPESSPSTMFQNCTGLYDPYHYSTCYDMAIIMAYAMKNTFCANVLTTFDYRPSDNFRPGQGCVFYSILLNEKLNGSRTQPSTATITGGKTGFTEIDTSGCCMVSFAKGKNGHDYIVVTAKASSWNGAVQDTLNICNTYIH